MASVSFYYRSKAPNGKLSVRFSLSREHQIWRSTKLQVPKSAWDSKRMKAKNVKGFSKAEADQVNDDLKKLDKFILKSYNRDLVLGVDFDGLWLSEQMHKCFNRPKHEVVDKEEAKIYRYFSDFVEYWLINVLDKGKWVNDKTMKPICYKQRRHYHTCLGFIRLYEKESKVRLKHSDISLDFCKDFIYWMTEGIKEVMPYSVNYTAKTISRIKFFARRADEEGMDINNDFKKKHFKLLQEDTIYPYLNLEEIQALYDHDFSKNEKYDNVVDWLIISCWTALRVSDLLPVKSEKLSTYGFLEIYKTKKTSEPVTIPMHWMVKEILEKRNGNFPRQISDQKYNDYLKEACSDLPIFKERIEGSIFNKETGRKVKGIYPKWKLITSHIGRRSFATNHFGHVDDEILMDIGGWRTKRAFYTYLKKKDTTRAKKLDKFWKTGGLLPQPEENLKVVE